MFYRFYVLCFLFISMILTGCNKSKEQTFVLNSPSNINTVHFFLNHAGEACYTVNHKEELIIDTSTLGFDFEGAPAIRSGLSIVKSRATELNETWEMPWGEQRFVENNYKELVIELAEKEAPKRHFNVYFKAYDDGIAFRYELLAQPGIDSVMITNENTVFNLTGDHTAWWIPGDWDIYEHLFNTSKVSEIDALSVIDKNNLAQTHIPQNAVNTPITMRMESGTHISFHEADLTNYTGMTLKVDPANLSLSSALVGSERHSYKVKRGLPFKTPWRTIQIADKATALIESRLIENLNEPNKLGDISWFKPKKYVGIWWEMHIDVAKWDYGMTRDTKGNWVDTGNAHGKHGATTENAKRYIDFAAKNNITGLLVEGWNTGWEHWIGFEDREGVFDFITPYPDYDLEEVVAYGKANGVEIIMHHETSSAPRTYEQQLDTAYQLMQRLGIHSVKTGYVGKILPKGEYHHGQWMVNHYRKVLEMGAKYEVAINAHEPIKATGLRRTYPNAIAREGLRGQEFNAWAADGGNPPEHLPIVAFTRMLAGPIDFTPGVFDITLPTKPNNQINTTLAQQLALYVVIYSPIQMACDLPQNYEGQPGLQFIKDVGVDWEQTKVLNGEIGDYVTIARQEKASNNWFVGSITDENERDIEINFDFLDAKKTYLAKVYRDGDNAHYQSNPTSLIVSEFEVHQNDIKSFHLAAGGGIAISLMQVESIKG
jgi:glucan 1,4-alpha-glucosidase